MKSMFDDIMNDLTKNAAEYEMECIMKRIAGQRNFKSTVQAICANACNNYRQLVHIIYLVHSSVFSHIHTHTLSFQLRDSIYIKPMSLQDTCQEALRRFSHEGIHLKYKQDFVAHVALLVHEFHLINHVFMSLNGDGSYENTPSFSF